MPSPPPRREQFWRHPFTQIGFGCLALLLIEYNVLLLRYAQRVHWNDFGKFYWAAINWRQGGSLYAPTVATRMEVREGWMQFLNLNPPHFHLVILPLLQLSEWTAGVLWIGVNLLAAIVSCALIARELQLHVPRTRVLAWVCLGLASAATGTNAMTAQCTGLLLLPMTVAWIEARRGRWAMCGAWLGVLISLKPFLGLFLPVFLLIRQWRAGIAACASGLAATALGAMVFGWRAYIEWIGALGNVNWVWAGINGSMRGVITRFFDPSPNFAALSAHDAVIVPIWLTASAAVLIVSVRALDRSPDRVFALTVLVSLLISPLGWVYYLWLAAPACLALWSERVPPVVWIGLGLLCTPLFSIGSGQPSALASATLGSAYGYGMLLLWFGLLDRRSAISSSR